MIFATMASRIETTLKAAVVSGRVRVNVDEIVSEGHRAASQLLVGREDEEAEAKGESTHKKSIAEPSKSALKTPTLSKKRERPEAHSTGDKITLEIPTASSIKRKKTDTAALATPTRTIRTTRGRGSKQPVISFGAD
jgi:hypothetical protein